MTRLMLAGLAVSSLAFAQTVEVKQDTSGGVEVKTGGKTVKVQANDKKAKTGGSDVRVETTGKTVDVKASGAATAREEDGEAFSVQGAGGTHTHTCVDGQDVHVEGASNSVVLHGPCKNVKVEGASNAVETDLAAAISVEGTGNSVKWKAALKGKKPAIAKAGLNNTVEQLK